MPPLKPDDALDLAALRSRAGDKHWWRSLEQLAKSADFTAFLHSEFPHFASLWDTPIDRRRSLKLMAASMALAGLSACGRQPLEAVVSPVRVNEGYTPGRSRFYASALAPGGYAEGILAESREGRPVKIEGNPDHPASLGATDVFSQARILDFYDPERSQVVMAKGVIGSYPRFLGALQQERQRWQQRGGEGLCLLTGALSSPSQLAAIAAVLKRYPGARWFTHEPVSRSNAYRGAELAYGRPLETRYRFDRAGVIVSLDADFLGSQPGKLRYARDFMAGRRLRDGGVSLNRLYVVEPTPTLTGAAADHRLPLSATAVEPFTRALAQQLKILDGGPALPAAQTRWLRQLAAELSRYNGSSIVIAGDRQSPAVHALANAINAHLGNTGATVIHTEPVLAQSPHTLADLVTEMEAGRVDAVLILGANPLYTASPALNLGELLPRIAFSVHCGEYRDETARACHWHIPAAHPLESWDDARAYDGSVSLIQPLIAPLHSGITALQLLAVVRGDSERSAYELLREHWRGHWQGDFDIHWKRSLQSGVIVDSALEEITPELSRDWATPLPQRTHGTGMELSLRPDPSVWDGRYANNAWLQELPDPVTKLCWDNAALVSPALAQRLQLRNGQHVQLRAGTRALRAPVWIQPGQAYDSVTLSLGYGRSAAGGVGNDVGVNAYELLARDGQLFSGDWEIEPAPGHTTFASTQHHHGIEGHRQLRTGTLAEYLDTPDFSTLDFTRGGGEPKTPPSLYPAHAYEGHAWGMVIDVGSCIGCNACTVACQAENNIPVVGKDEVLRGREMHWIRVDRYYGGPVDAPAVHFQPVTCMHCEKAPCEYVCPVEATVHNSEGLNEMIYNRCIGTRYCSQNCPYKVRRFNWHHYTAGRLATPAPARNPEVTVRSRGVMEKCTYCVQRIQQRRIDARNEGRPLRDGDVRTACQQVCPTEAIVFGDVNDATSDVTRLKRHPLNYDMLGELNTRPRTSYLAGVSNPDPDFDDAVAAEDKT